MNKIVGLCVVFLFVFWITLSGNPAAAQSSDQKELKTHEIEKMARSAVYIILMPKRQGTGFLVSTDPPLVATAAHDVVNNQGPRQVWMRQNETGHESQVKAVHIHPDYRTPPKDPKEAANLPFSADVALLELELYKHDLGDPLRLKAAEDCEDLRAQEVVTLGFPFYVSSTKEERTSPEVVVREGIVARLCDYDFVSTVSPIHERPMLHLALIQTAQGDSGNPLLDRSGEVVGLVHGRRNLVLTDKTTNAVLDVQHFPVAIHVREVWKLLELKYPEVAKKLMK